MTGPGVASPETCDCVFVLITSVPFDRPFPKQERDLKQVEKSRIERAGGRTRPSGLGLCTLISVAALTAPASAQFGATAKVARPIPATNSLDATAAGSEVLVRDRIVAQTTDQLLLESAGTRVVTEGAAGSPFCVRLRGVACDQAAVMLGDVPISGPDTGSFDLSLVPLEAIEGFEVFRGGTPAWLNEGAIGGVLRFRPRKYEETEVGARLTGGSFGYWRGNVFGAASSEKVSFFGTAGGAGARNDYPYLDDNATLFDPTDDVERRRQNADFLEGFGFANMRTETSESSHLDLVFPRPRKRARRARAGCDPRAAGTHENDAADRLRLLASTKGWFASLPAPSAGQL